MLDEEIARLRQVRTIMETLVVEEEQTVSLLVAAAAEPEPAAAPAEEERSTPATAPVRHVSRRGIATGRRGPRAVRQVEAPPRPLDSAVPKAPVVVSRSALLAAKPILVAPPPPPAEGTLEAWVRSLKQSSSAA